MDKIQEQEAMNEKAQKVFNQVDPVLTAIDEIIPASWSRAQAAAVLGVYLELYK